MNTDNETHTTMNPENIVKLSLEYAATVHLADLNDPDEQQAINERFTYYCLEKFTAEEKEVICRVAGTEAQVLRDQNAPAEEIKLYELFSRINREEED